jgi:hypothetical protein
MASGPASRAYADAVATGSIRAQCVVVSWSPLLMARLSTGHAESSTSLSDHATGRADSTSHWQPVISTRVNTRSEVRHPQDSPQRRDRGRREIRKGLMDLAPQVGLEPTTLRLTAGCSAIELLRTTGGKQARYYKRTTWRVNRRFESLFKATGEDDTSLQRPKVRCCRNGKMAVSSQTSLPKIHDPCSGFAKALPRS